MWHDLWPQLPVWEVPITSITNGVHLPSWLNGDLAVLYDQYLQPDWRERFNDPAIWEQVDDIPDEELLEAHRRRKRRLVTFVRARAAVVGAAPAGLRRRKCGAPAKCSIPNAFTIGFARRFATYKRATLLFRDVERLKRILLNKDMPVQIVIAGKAHPKDHPGKTLIREIVQLSRDPELWKHVVFVEDYDMKVGRETGAGRRPLAEQPAPRRRGLRHQRHEGRHQRRAQPEHPGRLVRRGLRDFRRLGHRRPRAVLATTRTSCTPAPSTPCSKTKSCPCSTSAASRRRASGCGASSSR